MTTCKKCGSDKVKEEVKVYVYGSIPGEILYTCENCGNFLNFYAYGQWEDPAGPTF